MAIVVSILTGVVQVVLIASLAVLLVRCFASERETVGLDEIHALLSRSSTKMNGAHRDTWVQRPPEWLWVPERLSAGFHKYLGGAGHPYLLSGEQLTAWLMLRLAIYATYGICVLLVGPGLLALVTTPERSLELSIVVAGALPLAFAVWPGLDLVLNLRRMARKRAAEIRNQLPYAVDMFVMVLGAGGSFEEALEAFNAFGPEGPVRKEILLVLQETRSGSPRDTALANLALRAGIHEVRRLVLAVSEGERLGVPLVETMRDHAELLRAERLQRATVVAEVAERDARLWLLVVAFAALILFVVPFIMSAAPGLSSLFG